MRCIRLRSYSNASVVLGGRLRLGPVRGPVGAAGRGMHSVLRVL